MKFSIQKKDIFPQITYLHNYILKNCVKQYVHPLLIEARKEGVYLYSAQEELWIMKKLQATNIKVGSMYTNAAILYHTLHNIEANTLLTFETNATELLITTEEGEEFFIHLYEGDEDKDVGSIEARNDCVIHTIQENIPTLQVPGRALLYVHKEARHITAPAYKNKGKVMFTVQKRGCNLIFEVTNSYVASLIYVRHLDVNVEIPSFTISPAFLKTVLELIDPNTGIVKLSHYNGVVRFETKEVTICFLTDNVRQRVMCEIETCYPAPSNLIYLNNELLHMLALATEFPAIELLCKYKELKVKGYQRDEEKDIGKISINNPFPFHVLVRSEDVKKVLAKVKVQQAALMYSSLRYAYEPKGISFITPHAHHFIKEVDKELIE